MSTWLKQDTGVSRLTIVVTRERDPDVYELIQSFEYGSMTAHVKAALRLYLHQKQCVEVAEAMPATNALHPAGAAVPSRSLQVQHALHAPVTTPPVMAAPEAESETDVTRAKLAFMQGFFEQFYVECDVS